MSLDALNRHFGIDGAIDFAAGSGGMPCIQVRNQAADAKISLHGGQVLAYRPRGAAEDMLFVSEQAFFQADKAIKGGIPICWPWFGDDPEDRGRPAHGFARNSQWTVADTAQVSPAHSRILLSLQDDATSRALWPHSFRLTLDIDIADALTLTLVTRNSGEQPFTITQAMHTYFAVGAIDAVSLDGLDGLRYLDKVRGFAEDRQNGVVAFDREVDRIYQGVDRELTIDDGSLDRRLHISAGNSTTTVVWNPWAEISTAMPDLADDAYRRFVCVETANAADEIITVDPSADYAMSVTFRIAD